MSDLTICPGCGVELPAHSGATHEYIGANAACWNLYSEILGREYQNVLYMRGHQYTVDAYCTQHPGEPERRSTQSVAVHLLSLYAMFECGYAPSETAAIRQKSANSDLTYTWLTPPDDRGELTVKNIHAASTPDAHNALVEQWARQMWRVWQPHHEQIKQWAQTLGIHPK